jgi:uncharacterized repeat protein (TIGR01451 family)
MVRLRVEAAVAAIFACALTIVAPATARAATLSGESQAYGVMIDMNALGSDTPVVTPTPYAQWTGGVSRDGQAVESDIGIPQDPTGTGVVLAKVLTQTAMGSLSGGFTSADSDTTNVLIGGASGAGADVVHGAVHAYAAADPNTNAPACELFKGRDGTPHFDTFGSDLVGLEISGTAYGGNGAGGLCPNTLRVSLVDPSGTPTGLTAAIYEVVPDADGNGIQVNMIHVTGNVNIGGVVVDVDAIVGHAHAAIVTGAQPNPGGASGAQLTIHKDQAPAQAAPGDTVTYRLSVTNSSGASCAIQNVADELAPKYFKFVTNGVGKSNQASMPAASDLEKNGFTASPNSFDTGSGTANQMVWTNPNQFVLANGAALVETFEVSIAADTPAGSYPNVATVRAPLCGGSASSVVEVGSGPASDFENVTAFGVGGVVVASSNGPPPAPTQAAVKAASRTLPNTAAAIQGPWVPLVDLAWLFVAIALPGCVALLRWRRRLE